MVTRPQKPRPWRGTIAAGLLVLIGASCAPAPRDPVVDGVCDEVALLASNIMGLRQAGFERARMEATAGNSDRIGPQVKDLTLAMIDTAFRGWKIVPQSDRPTVIMQFGDAWREVCVAGGKRGPRPTNKAAVQG